MNSVPSSASVFYPQLKAPNENMFAKAKHIRMRGLQGNLLQEYNKNMIGEDVHYIS